MDRADVIKGLLCCIKLDGDGYPNCERCPYGVEVQRNTYACSDVRVLMRDALELLEAQEPVRPYIDFDGHDVWRCGNCGAAIFHPEQTQADEDEQNYIKFCRHCGKAVKWDG